jgi:hypothetical protein
MHPAAKAKRVEPDSDRRRRLELALEEGLRGTFPASDPVAVLEPAATRAGEDFAFPGRGVPEARREPGSRGR